MTTGRDTEVAMGIPEDRPQEGRAPEGSVIVTTFLIISGGGLGLSLGNSLSN